MTLCSGLLTWESSLSGSSSSVDILAPVLKPWLLKSTVPPPPPVASPGPLSVELRLANGQFFVKGYVEGNSCFSLCRPFGIGLDLNVSCLTCTENQTYSSYYGDAEYPVTKVLREPVYIEVHILERSDPNIVLTLGRCWATSDPDPQSLPHWDLLVNG